MSSATSSKTILIVDDELGVRKFVQRVLDEAGYRTTVATSGAEAIKIVSESPAIDLLLTDLKMPEMDGDELAAKLRGPNPDLKVLYLTGFSDALFKQRGSLWVDEAFLDKPCSVKGLLEAVAMLLFGRITPEVPPQSGLPATARS
jgi:two-component system cell cycle sensor histidine kinase/response regulator CckA